MTDEEKEKIAKLFEEGYNFYNTKEYEKSIDSYDQIIKIDPNDSNVYNNKGNILFALRKKEEAIEFYDKAIEIDSKYANAYYNKGLALSSLRKKEEAEECYKNAVDLYETSIDKADCYRQLQNWSQAGEFYGKGGIDIIEAISYLENDEEKNHTEEIIQNLLKHQPGNYFWKVLKRTRVCDSSDHPCTDHIESCEKCSLTEECKAYQKIYLESLQIIANLQVNHDIEQKVAHYTTKDSTRILLLGKDGKGVVDKDKQPSTFQLASTARANDPKEGITLLEYLFDDSQIEKSNNYRAFIGCFTFNHQSLNQFRLYGKEKGRDASGVSIVVKKDFFSSKIELTQNMKTASNDIDENSPRETIDNKLSLFRCIYIDPETKAVISLGHKELYAYIREEMEKNKEKEVKELILEYNKYQDDCIKPALQKVIEHFDELKDSVADETLNRETINELLLMLSHLVKHVAYKEEQECRILEIASLVGDDKDQSMTSDRKVEMDIGNDSYRMFIEYQSMADCVDRLYMGNQFEDFGLFRDIVKLKYKTKYDKEVESYLCNHPYASS